MKKPAPMKPQVLKTNCTLKVASSWATMAMAKAHKSNKYVAERLNMSDHDFSGRMHRGLTYEMVIRVAEVLGVPRPNLATLIKMNLEAEVNSLLNTPEYVEYGLDQ